MSDKVAPAPMTTKKPGRALRAALAVSVAINLGVAGLAVGFVLHGHWHGRDEMVRSVGFGPFTDALRPADREALRQAFLKKIPDFQAERAQIHADSVTMLTALRATPYDPAAFDAAMAVMQQHMARRFTLGRGLIEDFVNGLSPADRLAFADRLEASLRHGERRADVPSASGPAAGVGASAGN